MPAADLPASFWAGWILVLTAVSLIGLGWLVYSVYFPAPTEAKPGGEESPTWDGNLREGAHPAPMWWFWLMFASLAVSVAYLILYPGFGSYGGALQWSQGGQLAASEAAFERQFGSVRRLIADASLEALQADMALMASARRIYDRECAVCHGYDAKGQASLFPDLTDAEWQWGAAPADIERSIRAGRTAAMVGWETVLGDEGVQRVTDFALALHDGGNAAGLLGEAEYVQFCAACHGADGSGNPMLGAPSLIDGVSLYGSAPEAMLHSIAIGRSGVMPAFEARLDAAQIRLLTAFLMRGAQADAGAAAS